MSDATGAEIDWNRDAIVDRRERYYAASQRAFVPYRRPLVLKRGQGQYLWDEDDKRYLDLLGMNLCISVGHCHPAVTAAIGEQAAQLQHCTTMFHHPVPAHFAEELAATMPAGEDWVVHFTNSGAEAIDLALMMARSHSGHGNFFALRNSYHGATYGAQSLTGIVGFRHPVQLLGGIVHLETPDPYRGAFGPQAQAYLQDLDRAIATCTDGRLAGMIVEPLLGYGGIVEMPVGYIKGAFERVRAAGGVCIVDEVQSGFARTGDSFWAFEQHDVLPDIVVMAKGIGNGFPLAAVVARREVAECMGSKFCFHTYGANPTACAAGRAVLRVIRDEGLQSNARRVGAAMLEVLKRLRDNYPIIGDVRGRGLMMAIELVKDHRSKEPAPQETAAVFELSREEGLVLSKSGTYRNVLRMVPPLCISMDDVDFFERALNRSFQRAFG